MNASLPASRRPATWTAASVSVLLIVVMVYLRVFVYSEDVLPLTYVLPLLVGLWHRHRGLLWIMAGCFFLSATFKVLGLMPVTDFTSPSDRYVFLAMEWTNIAVAGVVVHVVLTYRESLEVATAQLQAANRQLETKVAERTLELRNRTEDLQRLASQLTMAEQQERRRLAQILHDDLQQLLVAAKIRLSSQRTPREASCQTAAALIDQAIERSRSLTVELSPPVLFQEHFANALRWLARRMQDKHGLEVRVTAEAEAEPDGENWRVFLFQAVGECLFNVVKHAGVHQAEVHLARQQAQLRVVVLDQGAGFAVPHCPDRSGKNDSFGLFSLWQRSLLLGGSMAIVSSPGQGTRVEFLVPAAPRVTETPAAAGPAASAVLRAPLMRPVRADDHIRVLLADDHTILRHGLASILHNEPGIEIVAEACDGLAAVELSLLYRPDVVVMDVTMPKLNGIEATQRLARELPTVKVIGMSMHEDEETRLAMLQAGAVSYLTKGGPAEELLGEIRLAAKVPLRGPHFSRSTPPRSVAEGDAS